MFDADFEELTRFAPIAMMQTLPPAQTEARCPVCQKVVSLCPGHVRTLAVTYDPRTGHYSDCKTYGASCWCAARREQEQKEQQA